MKGFNCLCYVLVAVFLGVFFLGGMSGYELPEKTEQEKQIEALSQRLMLDILKGQVGK